MIQTFKKVSKCKYKHLYCIKMKLSKAVFSFMCTHFLSFDIIIKKVLMGKKKSGKVNQKSKNLKRDKKKNKTQKAQNLMDQNSGYQVRNPSSTQEQIYQSSSLNEEGQHQRVGRHQLEGPQICQRENQELRQQNTTESNRSKDLAQRIISKFLDYLLKKRKISKQDYIKLKGQGANLRLLEQYFQNKSFRPFIAEYFLSRQFRRDVLTSKKKLKLNDKRPTNSMRNLMKLQPFIIFCFIQGSIKNFTSIEKPINDENSLFQNRANFEQLDQNPNPQLLDFNLESSPQLEFGIELNCLGLEDEQWKCFEKNNEDRLDPQQENYKR